MDVATLASVATELSSNKTAEAVSLTVLKKSMDIEAQTALQLLQAATPNNPPHLGNSVDIFA